MESKLTNLGTPIAIVIAGAFIAGALFFNGRASSGTVAAAPQPDQPQAQAGDLEQVKPVAKDDHVLGDPNAQVTIVEYSDTECPFCKQFHGTMHEVIDTYGKGQVAWVYRHFPLDQLHSKARKEAEATECAGELGGNEKFWAYIDRVFAVTPSNNGLDPAELPKIAAYVGLDAAKFNTCISSGKYAQHVAANLEEAVATGGQGTPWSVVIAANGKKYPLSGAQPYENVKALIEKALADK